MSDPPLSLRNPVDRNGTAKCDVAAAVTAQGQHYRHILSGWRTQRLAAHDEVVTEASQAGSGSPRDILLRWEESGGVWQVMSETTSSVTISLLTCTGDEEVDRLVSDDPDLLAFVGIRSTSQQ